MVSPTDTAAGSTTTSHDGDGFDRVPSPGELARRSTLGSGFMLAARLVQATVMIGTLMLLARWLTPFDFGLYAMVFVFAELATTLNDFALPNAVVSRPRFTRREATAVFWWQTRWNGVLLIVLLLLTPLLVWFYGRPEIWAVGPALALAAFISGAGAIPGGLVRRRMHFGRLALVNVGVDLAAAAAALALAWHGYAYWALVAQIATLWGLQHRDAVGHGRLAPRAAVGRRRRGGHRNASLRRGLHRREPVAAGGT